MVLEMRLFSKGNKVEIIRNKVEIKGMDKFHGFAGFERNDRFLT